MHHFFNHLPTVVLAGGFIAAYLILSTVIVSLIMHGMHRSLRRSNK